MIIGRESYELSSWIQMIDLNLFDMYMMAHFSDHINNRKRFSKLDIIRFDKAPILRGKRKNCPAFHSYISLLQVPTSFMTLGHTVDDLTDRK